MFTATRYPGMSVRVLFVCMGNICRSPTAHALFREAVTAAGLDDEITTDSAGTHAYHIGNPPDARATATALAEDIDMTDLRARQVCEADFAQFDYVVAMDRDNLALLEASCPPACLLYTSPSPRDMRRSRMPSSA